MNECQHCINPKSHRIKINSYDNRHSHPRGTQWYAIHTHTRNWLVAITTAAFHTMKCIHANRKTIPLHLDSHSYHARYNIVFAFFPSLFSHRNVCAAWCGEKCPSIRALLLSYTIFFSISVASQSASRPILSGGIISKHH